MMGWLRASKLGGALIHSADPHGHAVGDERCFGDLAEPFDLETWTSVDGHGGEGLRTQLERSAQDIEQLQERGSLEPVHRPFTSVGDALGGADRSFAHK